MRVLAITAVGILVATICQAQYRLILDAEGKEVFRYVGDSKLIGSSGSQSFYQFTNSEIKKGLSKYLTFDNQYSLFYDPLVYDAQKFRIDGNRVILPSVGNAKYVKLDKYDKAPGYEIARIYQKSIYNEFGELIYAFGEVPPKWIIATLFFIYWESTYKNKEKEIASRRKNTLKNTRVKYYLTYWESLIAPGKLYEQYESFEVWGKERAWLAIVKDKNNRFYPLKWEDVPRIDDRWLMENKRALDLLTEKKVKEIGLLG